MASKKPTPTFALVDLLNRDEVSLAPLLAGQRIDILFAVEYAYQANSLAAIADAWRTGWYIAETLGQYASKSKCDFGGDDEGTAHFTLTLDVRDHQKLASRMIELAPVFDPNDLESPALFADESIEWVETRGAYKAKFSELEAIYLEAETEAEPERAEEAAQYDRDHPN